MNYTAEISQNWSNDMQFLLVFFAALACVILLVFLVLLIFRKVRLWYWKVDLQLSTLKNIDDKLSHLEKEIRVREVFVRESSESGKVETDGQMTIHDALSEKYSEIKGQCVMQIEEVICKSKAGRIYTEKELDELIKN